MKQKPKTTNKPSSNKPYSNFKTKIYPLPLKHNARKSQLHTDKVSTMNLDSNDIHSLFSRTEVVSCISTGLKSIANIPCTSEKQASFEASTLELEDTLTLLKKLNEW